MHINHRRKNKQNYPWDMRGWKVPSFRPFRAEESHCLNRIWAGDDPENIVWPSKVQHGDDIWDYD